jgi:hypothetical protein
MTQKVLRIPSRKSTKILDTIGQLTERVGEEVLEVWPGIIK